jgi:putative copper export protein/mono/diheme cytochrome c family protein
MDPLVLLRAVMTLAAAIVMGSGFLLWYVRDFLGKPGAMRWRERVMVMILIAATFGILGTLGVVAGTAGAAAGATSIFSVETKSIWLLISQTWAGKVMLATSACSIATFLAAGIAWALRKRARISEAVSLVAADLAGLGLATIAFASHPTTLEPEWLGLGLSILHRTALGFWLGGLPALVLLIGTGTVPGEIRHIAYPILERFSRIAVAAMAVLVATGAVLTWLIVGNFASLIGTVYGLTLVAKLLALAAVLFIAHGLRRDLLPKLAAEPSEAGLAQYGTRVKIEWGFALLIVVLASAMGNLAPPEHEDIFWFLPFRFSFRATWDLPWVPAMFLGGSVLALAGIGLAIYAWRSAARSSKPKPRYGLALGAFTVIAGAALALPAISVQAFPDTYLTPNVDFAAESIAHGLRQFEDNCTLCHGVGGRGDGPAGFGLPVPPADLTAPHAARHTAGDMFWWLSHGIPGSTMPSFADTLNVEDRWDVINFLQAFTLGYQARLISAQILPNKPWLGPPDLSVTDETGDVLRLRDFRRQSALLLVIAEGPQGRARVEQLIAARNQLAKFGTKIVLVAPGTDGDSLRKLAEGKILVVDKDTEAAAATFGLFTRSLTNAKTATARITPQNAEFLIDRSGYLRARWLPGEDQTSENWDNLETLERQLTLLAQEPLWNPPKDHDH